MAGGDRVAGAYLFAGAVNPMAVLAQIGTEVKVGEADVAQVAAPYGSMARSISP